MIAIKQKLYDVRKAYGTKSTKNKNPNSINKNPNNTSSTDLPLSTLHNENALKINTIPRDIKLKPANIETTPALTNGQAINIIPNKINKIPNNFVLLIKSPIYIFI